MKTASRIFEIFLHDCRESDFFFEKNIPILDYRGLSVYWPSLQNASKDLPIICMIVEDSRLEVNLVRDTL